MPLYNKYEFYANCQSWGTDRESFMVGHKLRNFMYTF